ncbi:MAG: hypothetical protein KDB27_20335 [Planctomycetales bacterium]|nr:hypothetical protein [Planctomycetales bacterium]
MLLRRTLLALFALCPLVCYADQQVQLVEVKQIWNQAPHNAFTDLVRWKDKFYCAFREGQGHAGDVGKLRIIESVDGEKWQSSGLLSMNEYDLRDAALSITPDGKLMVQGGAQQVRDGKHITGTFVSFTSDGKAFTAPKIVVPLGKWLWRVTWHGDTAYGVAYGSNEQMPSTELLKTKDGIHYESVTDKLLDVGGWPTEARVRFTADGTAICVHRRDGSENSAYLGTAKAPYTKWHWHDLKARFGGPNFVQIPNGQWIGCGRLYDGGARTEVVHFDPEQGTMTPLLRLPSGGYTSYPGMVWHDNKLWVSYYASHEGKTNIYLAKVRFNDKSESAIDIGNRLELFVDRFLIDEMHNADLRLQSPRPCESVLTFDKLWEGAFCGYTTVFKDDDIFRMYYRGLPKAGRDGTDSEVTCYAESRDGVHWTKPDLGIFEIHGTRDNNVVLSGHTPASHNFSPFKDANPDAPADERYKALGGTSKGLIGFVSADGIHWKRIQNEPVFTKGIFDSQNVSFYSETEKQYVCYFRTWTETGYGGFRTVSRTTSKDFQSWTDPVAMTFGDTKYEHLYTNQTSAYFRAPHIYLSTAARFMPGRQVLTEKDAKRIGVDHRYFKDCSDTVLMSSRGGNRYDRTFMESFVRPGLGLENWVSRTNYPALGIVPISDSEISIYVQKNYGQPTSYVQRFSLRTDGFSSVSAGYSPGELITKPLTFEQTQGVGLHLNFSTSAAGSIRVELQDANGNALPGFTLDDCVPVIGDRIDSVVRWKSDADLEDVAGEAVRVRFELKDADLFSMRFQ